MIPLILEFPPERIFVTVLIVAPEPARPPKSETIILPIPWPISSLFELCLVFVSESATIEVKSESIAPRTANVSASGITILSWEKLIIGKENAGNDAGMFPIVATFIFSEIERKVPQISAIKGAGILESIAFGVKNTIPSVINPNKRL